MGILTNFGNGLVAVGRTLQARLGAGLIFDANGAIAAPAADPASLPAAAPLDGSEVLAVSQSGGLVQTDLGSVLEHAISVPGSSAQGDILYRNASGWTRLPAGTSGKVLQTNGAGANPSWVTPSGSAAVRTLATASMTAVAPVGTAVPSTGTVTLPSGTATSNASDTPRLEIAHGGQPILGGMHAVVNLVAFTGAGNSNAQACWELGGSSGTVAASGALATFRVFYQGELDVISSTGGLFYNHNSSPLLALDGTDWLGCRIMGDRCWLYTGSGASLDAVVWTLRAVVTLAQGVPLVATGFPLTRFFLAAQSSGGAGTVSAQFGAVTVTDLP